MTRCTMTTTSMARRPPPPPTWRRRLPLPPIAAALGPAPPPRRHRRLRRLRRLQRLPPPHHRPARCRAVTQVTPTTRGPVPSSAASQLGTAIVASASPPKVRATHVVALLGTSRSRGLWVPSPLPPIAAALGPAPPPVLPPPRLRLRRLRRLPPPVLPPPRLRLRRLLFALLSHSLWSLVACPTLPAAYTACYLLPCCLLLAPAVCCLPLSLCLLPTTTCLLPCCLLLLSLLRLLRAWLHLLYHPRIRVLRPPIEHLLYHPRVRVLRPPIEHPLSMPTRLPAWPGGAGGTLSGIPLGG